jgi:pectin methylesterase-like acyl-CoA thioesterase
VCIVDYRFLIHIKAGTYLENVDVPKKKTNLMLVGDGIGKTVVKASRNVVDGWTTFQSSTFGKFKLLLSFSTNFHRNY